jgi:hypothetical protein
MHIGYFHMIPFAEIHIILLTFFAALFSSPFHLCTPPPGMLESRALKKVSLLVHMSKLNDIDKRENK